MFEMTTFNNSQFGTVRTVEIDGEPWLVGKDVATSLGYSNPQKAIRDHVDAEDKTLNDSFTVNGTPAVLINESGMLSLVLSSKLESARAFKRWITSEVLPSIRKTGGYQMKPQMPVKMSDVFQAMAQTARLAEEASDTANNALKSISLLSAAQEVMDKKLTATADVLAAPSPADDVWQTETKKAVTRIVEAHGFGYQRYWQELYEKLEQRAGANLETRQNNLKSRLKKQGATAAEINNVSKLNVIARDKKLRDIFTNIIQREQARHILKGA